ncbi:hypothetical protein LTR13_005340 [Exophiala sideris]|nr:hypothetical protein LTR13_005340 [Exophiala sideris]
MDALHRFLDVSTKKRHRVLGHTELTSILRIIGATTGLFRDGRGDIIPGLLGAGIAFPEAVTDPLGNNESAVGMWKFMKYLQRVMPNYMKGGTS